MDYNTTRKKLVLPEYGRNIHKMVNYIKTIEDKDERNRIAKAVIAIMGNMNPHLRDINNFRYKLWHHLAIMADYELDIDFPCEIPKPKDASERPNKVPYCKNKITYKHYGKTLETLILKAAEFEDGEERDKLIEIIANHMKKSYLLWKQESISNKVIYDNIRELSNGKIIIDKELKLSETKDILNRTKKSRHTSRKPKR